MRFLLLILTVSIYIVHEARSDSIRYIDYGGKVPTDDWFDVGVTYDADGPRQIEVALKKPSENYKIYGLNKENANPGTNQVRAVTVILRGNVPPGPGYIVEVRIWNGANQIQYSKLDVTVTVGKQGFHTYNGKLYDANKNEFMVRGINNAHADYDNENRWLARDALPFIAATKANTVRILWRSNKVTTLDLDTVLNACVKNGLVPIVELHDATDKNDNNPQLLFDSADWWMRNIWVLIKYRKYIIVNIANEWSLWGYPIESWKNAYEEAIRRIRNAGFSGTLLIDASAYAQNPNGPKVYGQSLLTNDKFKNLMFSVHMYVEWSKQMPNYNIVNELQEIKNRNIAFLVGEFADRHPEKKATCQIYDIDAEAIMRECQKHRFGYIGWSWAGNGNYKDCGVMNYLDIVKNMNWKASNDDNLSPWGKKLINTPNIGIKATSKKATIFP